jgi:tetrahydromethanopterin S-methyltransferase subunit G
MKHQKSRLAKIDDAIEFTDSELKKVEEVIEE